MRHPLRAAIVIASGVAVLTGASLLAVYRASQQVPEFYHTAIHADSARQEAASKALLRTATSLVSDAQQEGEWEAEFTEEQINGWLAVDLVNNHGQTLPPEVRDPRVALRASGAKIGWRWSSEDLSTVFSLDVQLGLTEPNVVALTIRGARAGTVPLPLGQVLDTITNAAREMNLQLQWKKAGGHPVALIKIPSPDSEGKKQIVVESIELRDGSIYVAGTTVPGEEWSATRDWNAFLQQMDEHSARTGEPSPPSTADEPKALQAALPGSDAGHSDSSRNLQ